MRSISQAFTACVSRRTELTLASSRLQIFISSCCRVGTFLAVSQNRHGSVTSIMDADRVSRLLKRKPVVSNLEKRNKRRNFTCLFKQINNNKHKSFGVSQKNTAFMQQIPYFVLVCFGCQHGTILLFYLQQRIVLQFISYK